MTRLQTRLLEALRLAAQAVGFLALTIESHRGLTLRRMAECAEQLEQAARVLRLEVQQQETERGGQANSGS